MSARHLSPDQGKTANLFRLLWCRALGFSNVYTPFWILYLTISLHSTISEALEVVLCGSALGTILEVPTGWLADRYGRKLSLVVGAACCTIGLTMYATAAGIGAWLFCGITIAQLGWSLAHGADVALAADICEDHPESFSWFNKQTIRFTSLGQAFGGLLGGLVVLCLGLHAAIWTQVIVYLVMLGLTATIKSPPRSHHQIQNLARVAWEMRHRHRLLGVIAFTGTISAVTGVAFWLVPLYYNHLMVGHHHLPTGAYGFIWAVFVASRWVFDRFWTDPFIKRFGRYGSLALLVAIGVGCFLIMGLCFSPSGLAAVFGFFFIQATQYTVMTTRIKDLAKPEERATILSIARLAQLAAYAILIQAASLITRESNLSDGLIGLSVIFGILGAAALVAMTATDRKHQEDSTSIVQS